MKRTVSVILAVLMLAAAAISLVGCGGSKPTITLLNWGEYLDPEVLSEFNKNNEEFQVVEKKVTSNEEMYAILSTEGHGYDMCVPSEYMVENMMAEDMLEKIDTDNIENYKYVKDMAESRSFDPNSEYSIPYMYGTLGIVYNTTLVDDPVDSWDILWNEKYSGQIMMYDSVRDSMAVALLKLGYDMNTKDAAQIEEARDLLIEQKPLVLAYLTDEIKDSMISGSVALAVDYSGAAVDAISKNPDLAYVVPKEGSNIWVDNIVIVKGTKYKEYCEQFISYLCDPEVAARNSEYIGYTTPVDEAIPLVDEELSSIPGYVITEEERDRCRYYEYLGDALDLYYDAWTKVNTTN